MRRSVTASIEETVKDDYRWFVLVPVQSRAPALPPDNDTPLLTYKCLVF